MHGKIGVLLNNRVAIVATYFYPSYGGMQNFVARLARGLRSIGVDVTVVAPGLFRELPINETPADIRAYTLKVATREEFWGRVPETLCDANAMDHVLAAGIELGSAVGAQFKCLGALARRGSVVCLRVATSNDITACLREEIAEHIGHFAAVAVLNPHMVDELRSLLPDYDRVSVVPVIADSAEFGIPSEEDTRRARTQLGLSRDDWVCLWVGRLHPDKRAELALRAWQAAGIQGTLAVIGSDEDEEQRYLAEVRAVRQGMEHANIRFFGARPADGMRHVYSAGDCLLVTSAREGMCNSVVEGLSCGLPVVACDIPGTRIIADLVPTAPLHLTRSDAGSLAAALCDTKAYWRPGARTRPSGFDPVFGPEVVASAFQRLLKVQGACEMP